MKEGRNALRAIRPTNRSSGDLSLRGDRTQRTTATVQENFTGVPPEGWHDAGQPLPLSDDCLIHVPA